MNHSSNGSHRPGVSTLAVHAGELRQKAVNSITDPIVCSATYTFANTQAVIRQRPSLTVTIDQTQVKPLCNGCVCRRIARFG